MSDAPSEGDLSSCFIVLLAELNENRLILKQILVTSETKEELYVP